MRVAEDLHLDVLGARDVALEEDRGIAEGAPGFALRLVEHAVEIAGLVHDAHAASAAAEAALMISGKPICFAAVFSASSRSSTALRCPGTVGTFGFLRQPLAAVLSPNSSSSSGVGPTKVMPACCAGAGEVRVLGEETVAGMDRVDALLLRDGDDAVDVEVAPTGSPPSRTDQVGFVGLEAMEREAVFLA